MVRPTPTCSAFLAEAADRLTTLTTADDRLAELAAEVESLEADAGERAATVSRAPPRGRAGPGRGDLDRARGAGDAGRRRSRSALDALPEPGPSGAERVELRLSAGPGQSALPLAKAASGGELSRTMLACRSVLADLDEVPTLVFDEVDAGIGGRAGLAVGRRLARLARDRQVLVVTHLPQIACFADRHVRVRKDDRRRHDRRARRPRADRRAVADARRSRRIRGRGGPCGGAPDRGRAR